MKLIFVFIWYFIGSILSEKYCQKQGVQKKYKKGRMAIQGVAYRIRASNLLHTISMGQAKREGTSFEHICSYLINDLFEIKTIYKLFAAVYTVNQTEKGVVMGKVVSQLGIGLFVFHCQKPYFKSSRQNRVINSCGPRFITQKPVHRLTLQIS